MNNYPYLELIDIEDIGFDDCLQNVYDITVDEDESFMLSNSLLVHNSAVSGLLSGRDPKTMACFPLRGKPINVTPMDLKDILENKEFKNIMTITGLQFGVKVESISDIRFGKIIISSDQDLDGYCIRALLINAFYAFWPELFDLNVICILNTPIVKVKYKKQSISFYSVDEFYIWKEEHKDERWEWFFREMPFSTL